MKSNEKLYVSRDMGEERAIILGGAGIENEIRVSREWRRWYMAVEGCRINKKRIGQS